MEIDGSNKFYVCLYEAMGTALLLIAINWGSAFPLQPVAIGATVFSCIISLGPICGAHFNAAVSIGVYIKESKASLTPYFLMILLSQIIGGIFGVFIVWLALIKNDGKEGGFKGAYAVLCPPQDGVDFKDYVPCEPIDRMEGKCFLVESLCTFLFVAFILSIKNNNGSFDIVNAMGVSITLIGMIYVNAGISGACINPTVGLVQSIFQSLLNDKLSLKCMWVYIVAPATGGLLAGLFMKLNMYTLGKIKLTAELADQSPHWDRGVTANMLNPSNKTSLK